MRIFLIFLLHYVWSSPREAMEMLGLSHAQYALWLALGQVIHGTVAVVILLGIVSLVRYCGIREQG
jgi:hypothetical protein